MMLPVKRLYYNRSRWRKNSWRSMTDENGTGIDDVTASEDVIIEDEVTEVTDGLKVAEDD